MNDDLDNLISRYLDGTASAGEVEHLEGLLAADPTAVEALYQASFFEVLLRDAFAGADAPAGAEPIVPSRDTGGPIPLPVSEPSPAVQPARTVAGGPYRLPVRRFTWRHVAAVAACVLVGIAVVWRVTRPARGPTEIAKVLPPEPEPPIARIVTGGDGASIDNPWGTRNVAGGGNGDRVATDEQIRTGPYGSATVTFDGESTRVRLAQQTTVMLAGGWSKRLELIAGRVDCEVAKQSPDHPLVVVTPQAQVTVVGTKFDVSVNRDWTRLQVTEGIVRVMRRTDGATVEVSAGEYVDIPGGDARPPKWAATPTGQNMGEFWSVKVRPAGIDQ